MSERREVYALLCDFLDGTFSASIVHIPVDARGRTGATIEVPGNRIEDFFAAFLASKDRDAFLAFWFLAEQQVLNRLNSPTVTPLRSRTCAADGGAIPAPAGIGEDEPAAREAPQ